jgi:hypothetical protein
MLRPFVIFMTSAERLSLGNCLSSMGFRHEEKTGVKSHIRVVQTSIMVKLDTINPRHNTAGVQGTE